MNTVIVTGGLGYIGSHTVIELLNNCINVIIIDNCSSISVEYGTHIYNILNEIAKSKQLTCEWYNINIINYDELLTLNLTADWIIHFAAYKSISDSNTMPLEYYHNNICGLLNILQYSKHINCKNFIFSSSATVYSQSISPPFIEDNTCYDTNTHPYGNSKIVGEKLLIEIVNKEKTYPWNIVILRYFNPVGAHPSGLIGEQFKNGKGNNLFPAIINSHIKNIPLTIYGNNYLTHDGTAVRDYIHVVDLANAHTLVTLKLSNKIGIHIYNVGLGYGKSVLDVVNEFTKQGLHFEWKFGNRRHGDSEISYCDNNKITSEIGWNPQFNLYDMVNHTISYIKLNLK
jgi:UDP-glucose 4-epimerase